MGRRFCSARSIPSITRARPSRAALTAGPALYNDEPIGRVDLYLRRVCELCSQFIEHIL